MTRWPLQVAVLAPKYTVRRLERGQSCPCNRRICQMWRRGWQIRDRVDCLRNRHREAAPPPWRSRS